MAQGGAVASGFLDSANTVLLVISIISGALAIVAVLGSAAVVFGGSWRKSEMEMLRQSRIDLTSVIGERDQALAAKDQALAAKDTELAREKAKNQELTYLATQRQPFEQITEALAEHHKEASLVHAQILGVVERIASKLGEK